MKLNRKIGYPSKIAQVSAAARGDIPYHQPQVEKWALNPDYVLDQLKEHSKMTKILLINILLGVDASATY